MLYFAGFFIIACVHKGLLYQAELKEGSGKTLREVIFGNFYNFKTSQLDKYYLMNIILRVGLSMASVYCAISSIHYANLANINFGIISCCFIVSIIINSSCGYFLFGEKINKKVIAGIFVTISGIIWISLAKG